MQLTAITRQISPTINRCELTYHERKPIDVNQAIAQHKAYEQCLERLGVRVISLPAMPDLPDSVFVEDAAIIVDELAILTRIGTASRRAESAALRDTLSRYRPVKEMTAPATVDGGDVVRAGHDFFIGNSQRTNCEGARQLGEILSSLGSSVQPVNVQNCLHLKSACSYLGNKMLLVNSALVDPALFGDLEVINVDPEEPAAANALMVNETVMMPDCFPKTISLLERRGFKVEPLDVSELQKAEAGVTCCSLIFNS
jgi:dimethylargininase